MGTNVVSGDQSNESKILLIEGNLGDAQRIKQILETDGGDGFTLIHADSLSSGLACLEKDRFELVILNLFLSDSDGLDAFVRLHAIAPEIPVIVLTDEINETISIQIMRAGAQDYLVKKDIDSNLLVRSIRYGIERQRLISALESERQKIREGEEVRLIERFACHSQTCITAKLFGMGPLRETLPNVFDEMAQRYSDLLDMSLEQRTYKVNKDVSEKLQAMGEDLGVLRVVPRDLVELHTSALSNKKFETTPQKFHAYAKEGRFMLIEIMGYLTIYYRSYSIGIQS